MPETSARLGKTARLVYYYLLDHSENINGQREITVRKKVLADYANVKERTVGRALRKLEALEYITTYGQIDDWGGNFPSRYVIHPITAPFSEKLLKLHHDQQKVEVKPVSMNSFIKGKVD